MHKQYWVLKTPGTVLMFLFFVSGFTALLYQVVCQRMLGLFSGGTAHTIGVKPLTRSVQVIELLGTEKVLQRYAKTGFGQPLQVLFQNPRYQFIVGDGQERVKPLSRKV